MSLTTAQDEINRLGQCASALINQWILDAHYRAIRAVKQETAEIAYEVHFALLDHDVEKAKALLRPLWEPYRGDKSV